MDVFRPERFNNMDAHLRVLALSLKRAADEPRLPIALSAVADFVDGQLAVDAGKVADVSFGDVRAALAEFRAAAEAVEADRDPLHVDAVNRLLMATRHTLVPWLYADDGNYEQSVPHRLVRSSCRVAGSRLDRRQGRGPGCRTQGPGRIL